MTNKNHNQNGVLECGSDEVGGGEKPGMADDPELVGNAEAGTSTRTTTRTKSWNDDWLRQRAKVQGPKLEPNAEHVWIWLDDGFSPVSSCFHLIPLGSAVLIIKMIFLGDGQPCRPCGGVGRIPWNRLA
jgi:hypothetical protein